ncbi:prephenate dehydratase [bacterium]|nr:prephenate dehydratase [bacterium]
MSLDKARQAIDKIDEKIVELLNRRARRVLEISRQKERAQIPVFAPDRESKLLARLKTLRQDGPFPLAALHAIYREIISASISLQAGLKIAYFGPEGTFTHQAAKEQFGASAQYLPVSGIADVFREVECGRADYGVVPVENSTEGVVNHTLDMFADSVLNICSEVSLRVEENLLSRESGMATVKKVYSHPQPLAQCRLWLDGNLPEVERVEVSSTAKAAQMAFRNPGTAAIASRLAAQIHGLQILAQGIEDSSNNVTRFLVLGRHMSGPTGRDKTSIMLAIRDSVGALHKILKPFSQHRINLSSIESRPSRERAWNYLFFIDCYGHVTEPKMKRTLAALKPLANNLKVLGSYPRSGEK